MTELALLATQAETALNLLADLPVGTVREVRKGLAPISAGAGKLIESVAGAVDKLADSVLVEPERRKLARLQQRFHNEHLILCAKVAKEISEFQVRQHRSCLAFLRRESSAIQREFRAQVEFLRDWKDGILNNLRYGRYPDREFALEDLRIVGDLVRFEVAVYRRARAAIVATLVAAQGLSHVTLEKLEGVKARTLFAGQSS